MAAKIKEALGVMSDALKTAFGFAVLVVALYALLFVDIAGRGALWDSLRGVMLDALPLPSQGDSAVQMRVVPVRPAASDDAAVRAQNNMLLIPNEPVQQFSVPVMVPQTSARAAGAPASPAEQWRRRVISRLRALIASDADAPRVAASSPVDFPAPSAAPPAPDSSSYRAGLPAGVRLEVIDRVPSSGR